MFAYLLIGIELAILYGVFWYVFVRDPKPYNINGDLWGSYNASSNSQQVGVMEGNQSSYFQSEIDNIVLEARQQAATNLGFERRVPRPAFPTPVSLSSAYDPTLYSMPSSQCTPGLSQTSNASFFNHADPRDPYLDYPQADATYAHSAVHSYENSQAKKTMLYKFVAWLENISVKLP